VHHANRLEVDLRAIEANLATIRRACNAGDQPAVRVCAVVKADAYGMGAAQVSARLDRAGVDLLAVYSPSEARTLIEGGVRAPILIMAPVRRVERADPIYWSVVNSRVHFAVHDQEQVETLARTTERLGVRLQLHIEVDTGMSRGGLAPDEAARVVKLIHAHPRLELAGVYSHFIRARGDAALTVKQSDRFVAWLDEVGAYLPEACMIHQANTFATFRSPTLHLGMVRVGLGIYGYAREEMDDPKGYAMFDAAGELQPCARWMSEVVHIKTIKKGQTVGYGALWKAERETRIALVPAGYADGYPLSLSNKTKVGFELPGGERVYADVVGRINMDQITVDITDVPEEAAHLGSPVEVLGRDKDAPNYLGTVAHLAGTTTHELLSTINPRMQRVYVSSARTAPAEAPKALEPAAAL
jgi:alanine racemase